MSFFRRKDKHEIPPVDNSSSFSNVGRPAATGGSSAYSRSNATTYNASRDGPDPYGSRPSPSNFYSAPKSSSNIHESDTNSDRDRYGRNAGVGDPYSRIGGGDVDSDRQELFAGYNADRSAGANRFADRAGGGAAGISDNSRGSWRDRQPQNQEEEEDDVEMIKKDTRAIKQESVASSRNALRMAREAEETARNTLSKLGDQSEKIANVERHLDVAKANTARAEDRTSELKQLNKSIFRPVITFNKEDKRRKEEARLAQRHTQERDERENALKDARESQQRIGRAATYGQSAEDDDPYGEETGGSGYGRRNLNQAQQNNRVQARSRFQFEKTASDDELEDELDDNVDEMADVTKRLKSLAMGMGDELDSQNTRLGRIGESATKLDDRVNRATNRLKRV